MKYLIAGFLLSATIAQAQFVKNNGIQMVNSAALTVNGDWINDAGTSIKNDGTITTTDTWTNNGTLDVASTGGFVLDFSSDKTFTPGGTNFGFLSKQGTGNANITGQFSVKDSLSIKGGVITPLTASDILTVAETGTVTSLPGSFLEGGNLIRKGTGTLFFPVGKNGVSLPITFLNVAGANPSISVTVEDAPVGYSIGAGIDSLVNFPYVWRSVKTNVTDTASYVEVEYPNSLPVPANAIVVRKIDGQNTYEGMGRRSVTNSGGIVTVRSYSRGLQGIFSIAAGFAGNLDTDKAVLEDFYNATSGSTSWTNKNQWLSTDVTTWAGVTETGGYITAINLPGNKIKGNVPINFSDLAGLQTINLSGNELTSLPDLSSMSALTSLNVSNNNLDFASLEPNAGIPGINYSNQADLNLPTDELVPVGTAYSRKVPTGGTANQYQWKKNGVIINGANTDQFDIASIGRTSSGTYLLEVTNTMVPGLTLKSGTQKATAVADITGKLQVDGTTPVTKGKMTLLKINPVGQLYTTVQEKDVNTDGTYTLEKVVLDDYILVGQADTILYKEYFPTYFDGSIFWEEADTIKLNENRSDVTVSLVALPTVKPKGVGELSGIFESELPGGRIENRGRVKGASATVRRQQGSGRPGRTMAGEVIVAMLYTDENGEFNFEKLEEGSYILNLQYPGVPMDTKSDVVITIGSVQQKQNKQKVEALAIGGKIVVKRLLIVGMEGEQATIQIYPNPVSSDLYVNLTEGSGDGEMKLFDESGREVASQLLSEGRTTSDLSQLSPGIYILKIYRNNKEVTTARMVVE